jgi:hypothetical protein
MYSKAHALREAERANKPVMFLGKNLCELPKVELIPQESNDYTDDPEFVGLVQTNNNSWEAHIHCKGIHWRLGIHPTKLEAASMFAKAHALREEGKKICKELLTKL